MTLPAFLTFPIISDTEAVCVLNAASAAPDAVTIAAVFVEKFSAWFPASARTAFFASTEENRFANATSSPSTEVFSFFSTPSRPSCSNAAAPDSYPSCFNVFAISLDGDRKPCIVAFNCVVTSDVLPVTPVSVAIAPKSSSSLTFRVDANGTTCPMDDASSGKVVCPSFTVWNARSEAFCIASADVSP